jgi:predicted dithiol-disulfide oxidoreductase (DUF899 family)
MRPRSGHYCTVSRSTGLAANARKETVMSLPEIATREEWLAARKELLAKLERWKAKKGWDVPWYSSFGSDFNYDFGVTIDESVAPGEYNYRTKAEFEARGSDFFDYDQPFEMPGRSCFLQADGRVFHTYSQYARGLESTGGSYYFLDLTALGRQEEWEEPEGRSQAARPATPDFAP